MSTDGTKKRNSLLNSFDSSENGEMSLEIQYKAQCNRTRTTSMNERIDKLPYQSGTIKSFCRKRGFGYVIPSNGEKDIYVHISEIMSDFIPMEGDSVRYRVIGVPPQMTTPQAVDVHYINSVKGRKRWSDPPD